MLNYLKINDFALIENASVEFSEGFTVVTGESGAGKSILMGAIELLAGGRADRAGIRTGCRQYTVCGEFSVPPTLCGIIGEILEESGIRFSADEPFLTLRRTVSQNNTRNFINDIPVSARLLADIGGNLVDLHGANEQISLTVPARQLELLDNFGDLNSIRRKCSDLYLQIKNLAEEKNLFEKSVPDAAEADRCSLIAEEIERISPARGEDVELAAKQRLGSNAREVLETISMLTGILTENENGIADQLGTVYHYLSELERIDDSLTAETISLCSALQADVSELSGKLASLTDKIDLDPEALAVTEARLGEIHTLKRRYGPTLEHVFETREKALASLKAFDEARERKAKFIQMEKELSAELTRTAAELSSARKIAAEKFLREAEKKLAAIGFEKASLKADFTEVAVGASGMDKLELLFSANCGEELKPLRKVASSGELSRVMLALKTVLADADAVPTVIFDEIDMNIGGETANKVGSELHSLGEKRQVLCISHLAQVAARADSHLQVSKHTENDRTVSEVEKLDDPVPELARMLGGGQSAMQHAEAMYRSVKE